MLRNWCPEPMYRAWVGLDVSGGVGEVACARLGGPAGVSVEWVVPGQARSRRRGAPVRAVGLHALNEVEHDQDEQNRGQQDPQCVQGAYWSRLPWHALLIPRQACWYARAN